jgi:hypothetical protein
MLRSSRSMALGLCIGVLAIGACRTAPTRPAPRPVTVRVVNTTGVPATVWVARDSAHARLGSVPARGRGEWPVPWSFLQGRDTVGFIAFRDGSACVQRARFGTAERRRFTMVLRRTFPEPGAGRSCRWE